MSAAPAETRMGFSPRSGVKVRITENLTLGHWTAFHFGHQMEQYKAWDNAYDSSGYSGYETNYFPLPSVEFRFGTVAGMTLTGMAELVNRYHFVEDDYIWDDIYDVSGNVSEEVLTPGDHHEIIPRTGIKVSLPLGPVLILEFRNWFERRLLLIEKSASEYSKMQGQHQGWRWRPQLKMQTTELIPFKLVPYVYYEGYDFKGQGETTMEQDYISEFSLGVTLEPIQHLSVKLGERYLWKPQVKKSPMHNIALDLFYTFDISIKK